MVKHSLKIGLLIAGIALVAGVFVAKQSTTGRVATTSQAYDELTATIFSEPREISQFMLIDDQGKPFSNKNLKQHWTFLFFGFTNCGGICPTTMSEMAKVFKQLPEKAKATNPLMVFVTIDPARDTRTELRAYLNSFNPAFIGVTGPAAQLANMRNELGILAMQKAMPRSQANNPDNIDHSGTILLFNPQGKYVGLFSMPHEASSIVQDFTVIAAK